MQKRDHRTTNKLSSQYYLPTKLLTFLAIVELVRVSDGQNQTEQQERSDQLRAPDVKEAWEMR